MVFCDVTGGARSRFRRAPPLLRAHGAPNPAKCVRPRPKEGLCGVDSFFEVVDTEGARCGVEAGERRVREKARRPVGVTQEPQVLALAMLAAAGVRLVREVSGSIGANKRPGAAWEGVRRGLAVGAGAERRLYSCRLLTVDCRQSLSLGHSPGPQVLPRDGVPD